MNYGVQHRYHVRPLQGWPPGQFPLGHWGIGGLGQAPVPTGSTVQYTATWQLPNTNLWSTGTQYALQPSSTMAAQLLANVVQILKQNSAMNGLQVLSASQNASFFTELNFGVTINLFVSGPGFSQPNDAGSFVDSAYIQASGNDAMPSSSTVMLSAGSAGGGQVATSTTVGAPGAPGGTGQAPIPITPGSGACPQGQTLNSAGVCDVPQTMSDWFQSNATLIIILLAGVAIALR